jgi:apolipoprotein N-acyltransferase
LLRSIRIVLFSWRAAVAFVAGTALALAFPSPGWMGGAWVAPALLLLATFGESGRSGFFLGYLAGLVHFLISLRWLLAIPFPAGSVAAWLALSLYMALYPALWVWLCWRMLPRSRPLHEPFPSLRNFGPYGTSFANSVHGH